MQRLAESLDLRALGVEGLDKAISAVKDNWLDMPGLLKLKWTIARASCMLNQLPEELDEANHAFLMGQVASMHLVDTTAPTWSGSDPKCGSILQEEITKLEDTIQDLEKGGDPTSFDQLSIQDGALQKAVNACNLLVQAGTAMSKNK